MRAWEKLGALRETIFVTGSLRALRHGRDPVYSEPTKLDVSPADTILFVLQWAEPKPFATGTPTRTGWRVMCNGFPVAGGCRIKP
jgi:hypothetical protein